MRPIELRFSRRSKFVLLGKIGMRIAINGFGRIGRTFFRLAFGRPEIEFVAINDLGDLDNLAYLLKYDTVYRRYGKEVKTEKAPKDSPGGDPTGSAQKNYLVVDGKKVAFLQEKDPTKLPWGSMEIDVVIESTGAFESYEKASAHLTAGAKRVVISAPAKGGADTGTWGTGKTVLLGINESDFGACKITSNGSCTTNAVHPVAQILFENPGIKKAFLNTIHAYTATQKTVDGPDAKDWRRGRSAAMNLAPSSTGAAISVTEAVKGLKGLFDGIAVRVPVATGSLADFTFLAARKTSVEEINNIFREAAKDPRWKGIMKVSEEPIVSSDIIGETYGAIVDLTFTKVVDGDLVKVLSWYDNEWGYSAILVEHVIKAGQSIQK